MQAGEEGKQRAKSASYAALVQSILGRLESLACDCAVSMPPEGLLPAVQHTLDCVQGDGDAASASPATSDPELGDAWTCLAARFCSEDEWEAALGASWLLSLLLTAAERHLSTGAVSSAGCWGPFSRCRWICSDAVRVLKSCVRQACTTRGPSSEAELPSSRGCRTTCRGPRGRAGFWTSRTLQLFSETF